MVLLEAEEADELLDGALLGMAAAQCARVRMPELLEAICAYAGCRLASYGGREVAEMANAAAKLERLGGGFVRAVADYCAGPPAGAFKSLRDISLAARVLFQSLRSVSSPAVNYGPALRGLADLALPLMQDQSTAAQLRDAVEFAHALAHSCEANLSVEGSPLHKDSVIESALCSTLNIVRRSLHSANSVDVTMIAGAAAAAWVLMPHCRGTTFKPLLCDAASALRFRRAEFSVRDLALLAGAFAKTGIASMDLVGVLNDRTQDLERVDDLSNRDICFFLVAASQVESWADEPFAVANVVEVLRRDPSSFSSHDLSTLAQAFSRMGDLGQTPLQNVLDEAFRRQLLGFAPRDRAQLLGALAKAEGPTRRTALVRLLVRGLANDWSDLDRESRCTTLVALAILWNTLGPQDPAPQVLADALCVAQPWLKGTPSELASCAEALSCLPGSPREESWSCLLEEIHSRDVEGLSVQELCRLLTGLAPTDNTADEEAKKGVATAAGPSAVRRDEQRAKLFETFGVALGKRLEEGEPLQSGEALRRLAARLGTRAAQLLPANVAEQLASAGTVEPCAEPAPATLLPLSTLKSGSRARSSKGAASQSQSPSRSASSPARNRGTSSKRFGRAAITPTSSPDIKPSHPSFNNTDDEMDVVCLSHGLQQPPGLKSLYDSMDDGDDHPYGRGHAHTHGLFRGSTARCGACAGPETTHMSFDLVQQEHGHGHESGHGNGHGSAHDYGSICTQPGCCPTFRANRFDGAEVRLNHHCDFAGHCVQLKHTFLHIPCNNLHDSDSEGDDCVLCRLTRTRSSSF